MTITDDALQGRDDDRPALDVACLNPSCRLAALVATTGNHCQVWRSAYKKPDAREGEVYTEFVIKYPHDLCTDADIRILTRQYHTLRDALGGIVSLAGVVINNAIVLIDFIETRVREGQPLREAVAGYYAERLGVVVDPRRVVITPGASGALQLILGVLVDPLVGYWIEPWRLKRRTKQVQHPKFYFFDPGVVRALRDTVDEPLADADSGALLEGLILHELRAAISYRGLGGEIFYWKTPGSKEIDFIWAKGTKRVAVEVKNSHRWRPEYAKTINEFLDAGILTRGFVVYRGKDRYRSGRVEGLPVETFLSMIHSGRFLDP